MIVGVQEIESADLRRNKFRMISTEEELIDRITETFYCVLEGKPPPLIELPSDYPDNEIKQLVSYANKFIVGYNKTAEFMYNIARGELFCDAPKGKMRIIYASKDLQSSLRHLTWQTQQIAKGDFSQVVDFMGDFSQAFNSMNKQLKDAFETIKIQSFENSQKMLEGMIFTITKIVETKDPYTAGHQQRVAKLSCAIAKEIGLSGQQINDLQVAALIHDVGKIYIPAEILSKPGQLHESEFKLIKRHPQIGYDILKTIESLSQVVEIVLQHHERMDGSGYPQGLSSEDIILEAKILGVADVLEAISHHRPYRAAVGIGKALEEISKNKGIIYDPQVVDACFKLFYEKGFKFE